MYFHSAFYIFGITLVFVQCDHHREGDFHDPKFVECPDVRTEMGKTMLMTKPMPRNMPVQLMPQADHKFMPDTVFIPQCTGSCPYGKSPMAMETAKTSVHVSVKTPSGSWKCAAIDLDEHTKCKCGCLNKPTDCHKYLQWWDQKSCACKCVNEQEKIQDCKEAGKNMFWNQATCQCECTYMNMECASGRKWSRKDCGCMPISH